MTNLTKIPKKPIVKTVYSLISTDDLWQGPDWSKVIEEPNRQTNAIWQGIAGALRVYLGAPGKI